MLLLVHCVNKSYIVLDTVGSMQCGPQEKERSRGSCEGITPSQLGQNYCGSSTGSDSIHGGQSKTLTSFLLVTQFHLDDTALLLKFNIDRVKDIHDRPL